MKCPTCNILLATGELAAVEIDYCPKCWGVWLDRGELNLILKRASPAIELPESVGPELRADPELPPRRPTPETPQPVPGGPISWASVVNQTR